ncbi:MAG: branched-chain amino acid ABC transporter permease [Actinobacteria bacterium]|nr:branched-chain amino acid ABC transporter permease [Actinomycetota bacterium]
MKHSNSPLLSWIGRRVWPLVALIVPLGAIALFGGTGSIVFQREVTTMMMYMVVVVGYYIFVGNSGVTSFGHISFMIIGAYTAALLTLTVQQKIILLPDLPSFLADVHFGFVGGALLGAVVAAVFAAVIALPINRLTGISLSLAMFAILLTVNVIVSHWTSVTRGVTSMFGVPQSTTLGSAFVFASITIVAAWMFQWTRVGLRMRAAREDEPAARAVGISIPRDRAIAFILSGFFVGLGGALFAQFLGAFNSDTFYISTTLLTIAMLVIGGFKSLSGAVVGTVFVSALDAGLRRMEDGFALGPLEVGSRPGLSAVGLALCMLLVLVFRSEGLTGSREIPSLWRLRRNETPPADTLPAPATDRKDVS